MLNRVIASTIISDHKHSDSHGEQYIKSLRNYENQEKL